ncbi:MAG TPA: FHA domain-containing protein [Anaerolineales bacterium]|nr:FHA domain-containing protein [Anaerolineales bacterium]
MPKPFRVTVLALLLLSIPWISSAQNTTQTTLTTPDTSAYPVLQSYLTVLDGEGAFVRGLSPEDVSILENDAALPVETLEELAPGAQIVVAINPSPAFAVRDSTGTTRYQKVVNVLREWAAGKSSPSQDRLNFMMTGETQDAGLAGYPALIAALDSAPTDHSEAVSSLATLSNAIDVAGDATEHPAMGRAVLFISPQVDQDTIPALEDLGDRAVQMGVRVFVWMVTSDAFFETNGAEALRTLTDRTGGRYFAYSGIETLPDPESYFDPLRRIYTLTYLSGIRIAGEQRIAAEIHAVGFESVSPPVVFGLNVLPPNPIFVSPPDEISRALIPDAEGNLSAERRTSLSQTIEILIEFPDGYSRELVRTTLYVNGEIAAENTAPPFDVFTWDLSGIGQSDRYSLQVEALDELGLSSVSLEIPISVSVEPLPDGFVPSISRNSPLIVTVVVLAVGGLLIAVLLRMRKLRPEPLNGNGKKKGRKRRRLPEDPVFQPVAEVKGPAPAVRITRWANRLHWPQRSAPLSAPVAYLERIYDPNSLEALTPSPPHPIYTSEITLGNDPSQATFVLDDPSVAPLHARLHQNGEREFYLSDLDSIAGTYINYLPTNGIPIRIEHGDQLHFGRAGFRFQLNPPPEAAPPTIEPQANSH